MCQKEIRKQPTVKWPFYVRGLRENQQVKMEKAYIKPDFLCAVHSASLDYSLTLMMQAVKCMVLQPKRL
jgi:hypothetical protein